MTGTEVHLVYCGNDDPAQAFQTGLLNCRVYHTNNREACLAKFSERTADILVLDLDADPKEQFALLGLIEEQRTGEHFEIFVTGSGPIGEETRILCRKHGVSQIFVKPFSAAQFSLCLDYAYTRITRYKGLLRQLQLRTREGEILGEFFSRDMREHILNNRISKDGRGLLAIASVMIFEIRAGREIFSSTSPDLFAGFLSAIFAGVSASVYTNHGSVSKFHGEGVLATFGYPVYYNNDIYNAVQCALDVRNFIAQFNETRPVFLGQPVTFGIGIATGKIFAGSVGSDDRKEHLVSGDAVHAAARLLSLARLGEIDILADGNTYQALAGCLEARKVRLNPSRDLHLDHEIYSIIDIKPGATIAKELSDEELVSTYANKPGEIEFF